MSREYPHSVSEVLDDQMKFKPTVIRAVRHFAQMKPWRGSVPERQEKFRWLNRALADAYGVEEPRLVFGTDESKDSGSSCHIPRLNTIILRGRLSFLTFAHEWGHRLFGPSESQACRWSLNLFRKVWPRTFTRFRWDGHMLRAAPTSRSSGDEA
jgi:hypothetical protein